MGPLTAKEVNDLRTSLASMNLDELNKKFDEALDEQNNLTFEYDESVKTIMIDFINKVPFKIKYNFAIQLKKTYDKIKAGETLQVLDIRTLQSMIVNSEITSIVMADRLQDLLNAFKDINLKLSRLEESARHIGEFVQRAETEIAAGLKFKEGDAEQLQLVHDNLGGKSQAQLVDTQPKKSQKNAPVESKVVEFAPQK